MLLDSRLVHAQLPRESVRSGLLLVPEDRRLHGLVLPFSIRDNLALPNYDQLSVGGWVRPGAVASLAQSLMQRLQVRAVGPGQPVGLLSGGNQQKVVVGKWLARTPRVLIFDEPTRGVDVGARSEIYALMDEGETLLKAGDILIQRGTNHSWSVRGTEPCIVAAVLVGANPV